MCLAGCCTEHNQIGDDERRREEMVWGRGVCQKHGCKHKMHRCPLAGRFEKHSVRSESCNGEKHERERMRDRRHVWFRAECLFYRYVVLFEKHTVVKFTNTLSCLCFTWTKFNINSIITIVIKMTRHPLFPSREHYLTRLFVRITSLSKFIPTIVFSMKFRFSWYPYYSFSLFPQVSISLACVTI